MQRVQQLREFANAWLRRDLVPSDGVSVAEDLRIPTALRQIYEAIGSVSAFTSPHNQLRAPRDIEIVGDYNIFYDENQWVVRWAFRTADAEADDPIVWQGTTQDGGYDWYSEDMSFSAWIQVMTLWQLVNGGYEFGAYSSGMPDATQVVETHFPRVGGHQDGSTRFYGIAGQLICLAGPVEVPSVWAAAATPDDFEALSSTLGFEWDYSSADD